MMCKALPIILALTLMMNVSSAEEINSLPDDDTMKNIGFISDSSMANSSNNDSLLYKKIERPWPTGALLRSVIVPGWGQFYNRKYIKAAIYGGLETYFAYKARHYWRLMDTHQNNLLNSDDPIYQAQEFAYYKDRRDTRNLYLWLTGITLFISMFDAFVDAHMTGYDETDKVFEVQVIPDSDMIGVSLTYNFK